MIVSVSFFLEARADLEDWFVFEWTLQLIVDHLRCPQFVPSKRF